jgi:selenium metabolism protein YedF
VIRLERLVDARGLACPGPVISTKKALDQWQEREGELITIVDNEIARDNVLRFVQSRNLEAEVEEKASDYYIRIRKPEYSGPEPQLAREKDLVFLIGSELLGRGSDELGQTLSRSFFHTLAQSEILPAALIFINSGVKLACEDSPVLSNLLELDRQGVHILACGTCLDYFGLKNKLCVGTVSNMYTIVEQLTQYPRVVALP